VLFVILLVLLLVSMAGVVSADIFINEIMYNPASSQAGGDASGEWIELFNNGTLIVNLTGWKINDDTFDPINISPGEHIVIAERLVAGVGQNSFEAYWGNNDTVWNASDGFNATDSTIFSFNDNADTINLINSSGDIIDQLVYDDSSGGDNNGKTLVLYKGSFTESGLENGTPGANNDQFPPDFNKWVTPSTNDSFIAGLVNVTVNITDVAFNVNVSLINFNDTNFSMSNDNDLWYFVWNTSLNADAPYNITISFNDTLDFSNTDTLLDITVDNTKPNITNPTTQANSRNFISQGAVFNATVNVTDTNLLNVTCLLNGITATYFANISNTTFICNLTAPSTENDFEITFTAIDKAGNTNTTTANFTTKHTTTASLSPNNITISDLTNEDKLVNLSATLSNTGSNKVYDPGVKLTGLDSTFPGSIVTSYQACNVSTLAAGESCSVNLTINVRGGNTESTFFC